MSDGAITNSIWVAAASDPGLVRDHNEDGTWVAGSFLRNGQRSAKLDRQSVDAGAFLAVADGVGGAPAGEVASRYVLETMAGLLAQAPTRLDGPTTTRWLKDSASAANLTLVERGESKNELRGMATTLTGVYVRGDAAFWMNAGDSRLYVLEDRALNQLSRDHTLREMTGDPRVPGHIITNCFGTRNEFYLDTGDLPVSQDRLYLLCSDGLSDYASHETLETILIECRFSGSSDALDLAASGLVAAATDGGGGDNITCLVFRAVGEKS